MAIRCELCPHACLLDAGQAGRCRVRVNLDGRLIAVTYGLPVSLHVDPMEKKPLFHFLPGQPIFSLATVGCNLTCTHCQNWEISQANPEDRDAYQLGPEEVAALAIERGCRAVAFTYTEPVVFYEYTLDTARACRARGLKTVLVSAAYVNPEPFLELCGALDGAILDLKAYSDAHYREVCGGRLAPVLEAMRIAHRAGVWVEILNLLIPSHNDQDDLIDGTIRFLRDELSPAVPLHFTAFHPDYRLKDVPRTPQATLARARKRALEAGLRHVYIGNVPGVEGENTTCPSCGVLLVRRQGFQVLENRMEGARALGPHAAACPSCGGPVEGVWA